MVFLFFQRVKKLLAEFFGTFALVFAGTGAIVVNDVSKGLVSHVGIALTFGLIVAAMVYALGKISGSHINPAVTLGFWTAHCFPARMVLPYVLSQCAGALTASALLRLLFPYHPTLGATLPAGTALQSLVLEAISTFLLMFVILRVSTDSEENKSIGAAFVGTVVALESLFAGPISGASMNPARSLAPALLTGHIDALWVYIVAPTLGAFIAVPFCRCIQTNGCCAPMLERR